MINFYKIFIILPNFIKKLIQNVFNTYIRKKSGIVQYTTTDGIHYELDLGEGIDNNIYYFGCFEPYTYNAIKHVLKSGMTAIDIGANIGAHTFIISKCVGPNGKVIAFEPMAGAFLKLKKNAELNNFGNIKLENIGLSNKSSTINGTFKYSWRIDGKKDSLDSSQINLITLDEYISINKITKVDFIKIDVDGYEYKILQGTKKTLELHKPIIILELGVYTLSDCGDRIEDLLDLLYGFGYDLYEEDTLKKFKDAHSIIKTIPQNGTINAIASTHDISTIYHSSE